MKRPRLFLVLGDLFVAVLLVLLGFLAHRELFLEAVPRMLASLLPLVAGWLLLAGPLGLYRKEPLPWLATMHRVLIASLFIGPFVAVLRAWMLTAVPVPIFALVMTCFTTLGMGIWRSVARRFLSKAS